MSTSAGEATFRGRGRRGGVAALMAMLALWGFALASHARADLPPACTQVQLDVTCAFGPTGAEQSLVVPAGVSTVRVDAVGAAGGGNGQRAGGAGATASATVPVTPGSVLYVEVGGAGALGSGAGGWNGGGAGGTGNGNGGGGGGASDVRTVACAASCPGSTASLTSRLVVAAGGGGTGAVGQLAPGGAGAAAGADGGDGNDDSAGDTGGGGGRAGTSGEGGAGGTGGTAAIMSGFNGDDGTGGTAGQGGTGGSNSTGAGGGGGGLYGGGGGGGGAARVGNAAGGGGGGGGSSLASGGSTGVAATGAAPAVTITFTLPATTSVSPPPIPTPTPTPTAPVLGGLEVKPSRAMPGRRVSVGFSLDAPATVTLGAAPLKVGKLKSVGGRGTCVALPVVAPGAAAPKAGQAAKYFVAWTQPTTDVLLPVVPPASNPSGFTPPATFALPSDERTRQPMCRTPGKFMNVATRTVPAGAGSFAWDGEVNGTRLPAGPYELSAQAMDAGGRASAVVTGTVWLRARSAPTIKDYQVFGATLEDDGRPGDPLTIAYNDTQAALTTVVIAKEIPGTRDSHDVCVPTTAQGGEGLFKGHRPTVRFADVLGDPDKPEVPERDLTTPDCFVYTRGDPIITHIDAASGKKDRRPRASDPLGAHRRNTLRWNLTAAGRVPTPGTYIVQASAVNAGGQNSALVTARFKLEAHGCYKKGRVTTCIGSPGEFGLSLVNRIGE